MTGSLSPQDPVVYWHEQFLYALSGLSWAVGRLGEDAGYAGVVHDHLTHPTIHFPTSKGINVGTNDV
jgi:hypothetical protein